MSEKELFKGTAENYARFRPEYPKEFFDFLRQYFKLDGEGRLLDLGCGTGKIAVPFFKDFKEVVGVDPEPEMLDEAARQAGENGAKNISWVRGKAEDIDDTLGMFQLTTMGASFHWMEQANVLEKVYAHTEKGGGVAIANEAAHVWKYDEGEEPWKKLYKDLVRKFLGEERRAGSGLYTSPRDFEDVLDESSFGGHDLWTHNFTRTWGVEAILGFLRSTSFAAPRLFENRFGQFETELRDELLRLEPSGVFSEKVRLEVLTARRL